jgi:hypothetical protein
MQFGFSPSSHARQSTISCVFAPAYKRVRLSNASQLGAQCESVVQVSGEPAMAISRGEEVIRRAVSSSKARNFSLTQRFLQSANPGWLPNAVDVLKRSLLELIHPHVP